MQKLIKRIKLRLEFDKTRNGNIIISVGPLYAKLVDKKKNEYILMT